MRGPGGRYKDRRREGLPLRGEGKKGHVAASADSSIYYFKRPMKQNKEQIREYTRNLPWLGSSLSGMLTVHNPHCPEPPKWGFRTMVFQDSGDSGRWEFRFGDQKLEFWYFPGVCENKPNCWSGEIRISAVGLFDSFMNIKCVHCTLYSTCPIFLTVQLHCVELLFKQTSGSNGWNTRTNWHKVASIITQWPIRTGTHRPIRRLLFTE